MTQQDRERANRILTHCFSAGEVLEELEAVRAEATAAERERCAKIADELAAKERNEPDFFSVNTQRREMARQIAERIRAGEDA